MAAHNELGKWGEDTAAQYLMDNGYAVLHRDWHCGHRDLDIIASKDGELIIVEVKTRRNAIFIEPEEAVSYQKAQSISIAANAYVKRYGINFPIRFDIIAITGTPDTDYEINHITNAFYPPRR